MAVEEIYIYIYILSLTCIRWNAYGINRFLPLCFDSQASKECEQTTNRDEKHPGQCAYNSACIFLSMKRLLINSE